MASRKRLPKPKGESECSRRTATVPVTCFIDVKRNATTKTGYEGACSCSVRMRSVNAGSAVQARRKIPLRNAIHYLPFNHHPLSRWAGEG